MLGKYFSPSSPLRDKNLSYNSRSVLLNLCSCILALPSKLFVRGLGMDIYILVGCALNVLNKPP